MKKIICIVMALALCISLFAACGGNGSSTASTGSTSSTAAEGGETTEEGGESSAEGDVIDVLNQTEKMPVSIAVMTGFTQSDSEM